MALETTEPVRLNPKPAATTPSPSEPVKWWKKPCPGCISAGRRESLPYELLKQTPTATVVVCDCGFVYAAAMKPKDRPGA